MKFANVPAVITRYTSEKIEPKGGEGGAETQRVRDVVVRLTLTDPKFEGVIDDVFPGARHMIKAAAGKNDGENKASAFNIVMARTLPPLSVRMRNMLDDEVLSTINVKAAGKPTLRVSAGVKAIEMVIHFACVLPPEMVKAIEEHLSADLILDMHVTSPELPV